jgi:hypothetical protein
MAVNHMAVSHMASISERFESLTIEISEFLKTCLPEAATSRRVSD